MVPNITIIRSNRRTLALHMLPNGVLEVKASNHVSIQQINAFIDTHKEWIEKKRAIVTQRGTQNKKYINGETFLYLGIEHILDIGNHPHIQIKEGKLLFPQALAFRIQKELENWYIKQAKEIIIRQLDLYANEMKTTYKTVSFSDTRSKWGSCTPDNRLQFSWRLVMAPLLVLNYVVVHELAHTMEKNHSYIFWNKVRAVNPSYRQQIKWLKAYGSTLVI